MKVLVTGAGGFLGSSLVSELDRSGFDVRAVRRDAEQQRPFKPAIQTVALDVRDGQAVKAATVGCDAIVHLAAKVHAIDDLNNDQEYQVVNVEGTRHILDAAVSCGVKRLVFVSSVKVFGEETKGCVDESQDPAPQTFYGRSKWQAEQLVTAYTERYGLIGVSLRLPMVYGQTKKGNLYRMIEAIDHGRFPALPRFPAVRSLLHVENFVQAAVLCLQAPHFKRAAYIVADTEPYRVTDLYDWLRTGLGQSPPRWRVPLWLLKGGAWCGDLLHSMSARPIPLTTEQLTKLIGNAWYSSAAITQELGYRPQYSFESTVPELVAFYRQSIGLET